jgi:hypothetical protein
VVRPLEREAGAGAARAAKRPKILPHAYFSDAEYSLWVDGKVELTLGFPVVKRLALLDAVDVVVFEHAKRYCVYQEACECVHRGLDDADVIYRQMQRYTREGFPANAGLADCCVLLRRHTPAVRRFCEVWWEEIEKGSRRDQLSFNYAAWKCGVRYGVFPGDTRRNALVAVHMHGSQRT